MAKKEKNEISEEEESELGIRDAIYNHVCQLTVAGEHLPKALTTAIQVYEAVYKEKVRQFFSIKLPEKKKENEKETAALPADDAKSGGLLV